MSGGARLAARLVGIVGAVLVISLLLGRGPRDVTVVYDVSAVPDARSLEVEVVRGAEVLRRAELNLAGRGGRVEHEVRLPEGDYVLRGRLDRPGGATRFERPLEVREAGTIVLAVGG
ncbi:MAG TPA: hypothetical protein VFL83_16550 [Anaeromyxobacter sp.]|nr:hypothetical protein [Anaeromyxobacter sp.]